MNYLHSPEVLVIFAAMKFFNKKMVAYFLIIITFVMVVIIFFPSSQNLLESTKPVQIYFADNISAAHTELINKFNSAYSGEIEVVPIDLPFSKFSTNERKELLARTLRGKSDRIDIFAVDFIWVPRFARWAEPLDLYFTFAEREKIIPEARSSCYFQHKLVAFPLYLDIGLMYYRDDILRELPDYAQVKEKINDSISWSEFIDLSRRLKKKMPFTYLFAAENFEGLICTFFELLQNESDVIFDANPIQLNTPAARQALQLMVDLVQKYHFVPSAVTSFNENQCYQYALENDVPFMRGWPGLKKQYYGVWPNSQKMDQIRIAPLPHMNQHENSAVYGGWNLMIPKDSEHKREAVVFMHFLLQKENQAILYEKGGFLPISSEFYADSLIIKQNPELNDYRHLLDHGFHRPVLENYTKISDIVSYFVHLAVKGELSVEDALIKATDRVNERKVIIK